MDIEGLRIAVRNGKIEWMKHSFERMMERGISRDIIKNVLLKGEVIEDYPDDKPYPSALFLGRVGMQPYHAIAAYDSAGGWCFIITAYKPDLEHFEKNYKTRRRN